MLSPGVVYGKHSQQDVSQTQSKKSDHNQQCNSLWISTKHCSVQLLFHQYFISTSFLKYKDYKSSGSNFSQKILIPVWCIPCLIMCQDICWKLHTENYEMWKIFCVGNYGQMKCENVLSVFCRTIKLNHVLIQSSFYWGAFCENFLDV